VGFFDRGEAHTRSFLKAVSWRIAGSVDTFVISFIVTGRISLAGTIASVRVPATVVEFRRRLAKFVWPQRAVGETRVLSC